MSPLFEPVRFRNGARARNRVALAPLTNSQSHDDMRSWKGFVVEPESGDPAAS